MSDINALVIDNLHIWSSTVKKKKATGKGSSKKIELYGVKKLRELILDLAIRGLLVKQNSDDEPARVLLKKIATEKEKSIKEGKIKKQKRPLPIDENDKPFSLPDGWEWVRLGNIGWITSSRRVLQKDWVSDGIPFYRAREIVKLAKNGQVDNELFVSENHFKKLIHSGTVPMQDDIMLTGVGTIGFPYVVKEDDKFYFKDASVLILKNFSKLAPAYLDKYFRCPLWSHQIHDGSMGTTVHTLTISRASNVLISLPPLAEQNRIVAKVDELMTLCDQLEQQQEDSISAHQTLVKTLLDALVDSAIYSQTTEGKTKFEQAWERIAQHFDTLFTTEDSIDQLKQTILQLAVMGKLVPQNPDDEPAEMLIQKIAEKKEQLVDEGVLKMQKPIGEIQGDEKPFFIPKGWEYARLDQLCGWITSGSTPHKSEFVDSAGIPYLKVYNIRNQTIDFDYKPQYVNSDCHYKKLKRSILLPGDVVMNIVGPPLGKIAIIPDSYPEWNCNQAIAFFRPLDHRLSSYIYTYLAAGTFLKDIELIGTAGQDNISVTKCRAIVLPIPPVNEQQKIIRKVQEILTLCDRQKSLLTSTNETKLLLTDVITKNTLT